MHSRKDLPSFGKNGRPLWRVDRKESATCCHHGLGSLTHCRAGG